MASGTPSRTTSTGSASGSASHRTVASHFVRAALHRAKRRGEDVAALLLASGISPSVLDEPRARVTFEQYARLVQVLWQKLDDELIRADATAEGLAGLKPSFEPMGLMGFDSTAIRKYPSVERINHVHTPGNSSGIVDGAAAVLIGSPAKGKAMGLRPRARIVSMAVTGTDPTIMLTGPAPATRKALAKAGMTIDEIDLFEVNEAFAAVVLRFQRDLDVPPEKINVNGGAIAMGHPLGATGAMILGTLLDELEARQLRYGLATLCVGGGMGIATIIERL